MNFRIYLGAEAPSFIFVSLPGSAFYTIMKKCQFLSALKLLDHIWHFFCLYICIVDVRNGFFDWFSVSAFYVYDICADYDRLKPAEAPI